MEWLFLTHAYKSDFGYFVRVDCLAQFASDLDVDLSCCLFSSVAPEMQTYIYYRFNESLKYFPFVK